MAEPDLKPLVERLELENKWLREMVETHRLGENRNDVRASDAERKLQAFEAFAFTYLGGNDKARAAAETSLYEMLKCRDCEELGGIDCGGFRLCRDCHIDDFHRRQEAQ